MSHSQAVILGGPVPIKAMGFNSNTNNSKGVGDHRTHLNNRSLRNRRRNQLGLHNTRRPRSPHRLAAPSHLSHRGLHRRHLEATTLWRSETSVMSSLRTGYNLPCSPSTHLARELPKLRPHKHQPDMLDTRSPPGPDEIPEIPEIPEAIREISEAIRAATLAITATTLGATRRSALMMREGPTLQPRPGRTFAMSRRRSCGSSSTSSSSPSYSRS